MKSKDKGEDVTLQTPDGKRFPGKRKDDGIKTRYTAKYVDTIIPGWLDKTEPERVEALSIYRSAPMDGGIKEYPAPLDADMEEAARYLEHVKAAAPDTLGEGDAHHALRLHAELGNLRHALDGGDLRHAAQAGVAFGKSLEEMRVRLWARSVKAARKSEKGGKIGADKAAATRKEKTEKGYAKYREIYTKLRATRPSQSDDQLFQYIADKHGDAVSRRFGCGAQKGTVRTAVKGRK